MVEDDMHDEMICDDCDIEYSLGTLYGLRSNEWDSP